MKLILLSLTLMLSLNIKAQTFNNEPPNNERFNGELALSFGTINSLSISVEKEFTSGKLKFGPRIEFVNLLLPQSYSGGDSTYSMNAQLRIRLIQVEYQVNPNLRVGIAPFWLLGPLPQKGYYKTPTTFYTHLQIKEGFSLETSITTSKNELFQISFRKEI